QAWLTASQRRDWRYWPRYQSLLERKMSIQTVEALDKITDNILGLLENPLREGHWDRRGLVVGHVQSGKTGNYTGLICKAADAGYKIIIVLAGLHNNLRSQTQIRLEEGFLGYQTQTETMVLTGVGEIDTDPAIRPNCATTRAENGDFNTRVANNYAITPEQRPWLFVVKKNKTVLKRLLKWIDVHVADMQNNNGHRQVSSFPLLLIDDEADHASVDTGEQLFNADGTPDMEHEPRAINRLIRRILHSFTRKAYVGYTATPFANIFIHRQGETGLEGPDLFPQAFIINLPAPSNYVGPTRLFGFRSHDGRSGALPCIREVHDHVDEEGNGGWMPFRHKISHIPLQNGKDEVPPSLREAVASFILACAVRNLRGQENRHSSMLIHVTRFVAVQKEVHRQVEELVRRFKQRIQRGFDPDLLLEWKNLWEHDFIPVTCQSEQLLSGSGENFPIPDWEDIVAILPYILADISVRAINGTARDALDYADNETIGLKVIAIGGDRLARGLTLEGLCVSYFVRTSRMYDTLMQMGRWFGYRPGYID
ncbi:MAG: Z1 domain-containing protein, partial [Methylococcaceae bacterium]